MWENVIPGVRRLSVESGWIYEIEHWEKIASGKGGVIEVTRDSFVFVPSPAQPATKEKAE